jgi:hypothetical protein
MSVTAAKNGAGDAVEPFLDALTSAGKAAVTESSGDPKVIAVVKLGWLMKELTSGWALNPLPAGLPPDGTESYQAQGLQLTTLLDLVKLPGANPDAATALADALKNGPAQDLAEALDPEVIIGLVGADARLPTAYALGGGLRAMTPDPRGGQDQAGAAPEPTKSLVDALDSLSSHLPSHAARSVANSLSEWSQSTDANKPALRNPQVNLWRSVILGEKKGTELLEPGDYLAAAKQLESHYVRRAITSGWLWGFVLLSAVLFVGGIVVLFAANGHPGRVAAGASGVLAALGLTWKGIGGTLGKLVGKLEGPLWGAELDTAITDVITLPKVTESKPSSTPKQLSYANRRARALSKSAVE